MAQPTSPATIISDPGILAAFKEIYTNEVLEQAAVKEKDLLAWLPKKGDLYARGIHIPIRTGRPQGMSANFKGAQASHTASHTDQFFLTRKRYFGGISFDDETIRASQKDIAALVDVKSGEMDDEIDAISEELEKSLWRNGSGVVGTIAAITTGGPSVITFVNAEDVINFSPNQYLEARTADLITDRGGDEQVFSVAYEAGTITMTSDVATDHGWAVGDVLIRGAKGAIASDVNQQVTGMDSWIPKIPETSGTFLGVDRTRNVALYQGFRGSWKGTVEETLKKGVSFTGRFSAKHDTAFLPTDKHQKLDIELGSRAIRKEGSTESFGLPYIAFTAGKSYIRVYPATFCPSDTGWVLRRKDWTLHHLDGLPHLVTTDGLTQLRANDFSGTIMRFRYWCDLACSMPKNQLRLELK